MSCNRPLIGVYTGKFSIKTGKPEFLIIQSQLKKGDFVPVHVLKKRLSFPLNSYFDDGVFVKTFNGISHFAKIQEVPCGHCFGCRLDKAKEWSVRVMHECSLYKDNYFLTLTYADEFYKFTFDDCKRDVQLFLKRLRMHFLRKYNVNIRYFGCCEQGEKTFRNHFHFIIFNLPLTDLKLYKKSKKGYNLYKSKEIESLWPFGFVDIGFVSASSANYVARYTLKKSGDNSAFLLMSKKPPIGSKYIETHPDSLISNQVYYIKDSTTKVAPVPKSYINYAIKKGFNDRFLSELKAKKVAIKSHTSINLLKTDLSSDSARLENELRLLNKTKSIKR